MKTQLRSIIAVSLLSSLHLTAQVDQAQIVPFQAGTPARASDMNQNIQTLITAINNNTAQLQALQNQMSIIASVTNLPQPTLQQNLAGSVYHVGILEIAHGTSSTRTGLTEIGDMRHTIFGETGTLTLNTDNTLTITLVGNESTANLTINSGFDETDPTNPFPLIMDVNVAQEGFPETETLTGTWSLAGSVLTLDLDGDTETFSVSVDGNTLFNSSTDTNNDDPNITLHDVSVDVGVRISKPQPNIEITVESTTGTLIFNPANNGASEELNDTNTKVIVIKNTGNGNLVLGSSAMIQDAGGDFMLTSQTGSVTIAPGAEYTTLELDNPLTQGSTRKDAAIYLMSNDPDTPTFIVNIHSTNNP
jgi:hypothetical protein